MYNACMHTTQRSSEHCVFRGQIWWCVMKVIVSRMTVLTYLRPSRKSTPGIYIYMDLSYAICGIFASANMCTQN